MRLREKNKQMALYSAIEAKKVAYQNYKAMLIVWIQSTWIDNSGDYVVLKSNYAEKLQEAKEEFIRASIEVEHLNNIEAYMHDFDVTEEEAIKALERKKGRWTKKEEYLDTPTVCSLCGHEYVEYVEGWEWEETGDLPNYCPNCGARMVEDGK